MINLKNFSLLTVALLSLAACHHVKPNIGDNRPKLEVLELNDSVQVEQALSKLQNEMYMLGGLTHDVCANADGIINTEERIGNIIKQIEEHMDVLTPTQQLRYQELREQYRNQTGY